MMEYLLTCCDGREFPLPLPLSWKLEYGLGCPCDSFQIKCPWTEKQETILADAIRFTLKKEGETMFYGVVDECECVWQDTGCTAVISGRGLQALLLDNEAQAADFGVATLADILQTYVEPCGIQLAQPTDLPAVTGFSVSAGSSRWQAVYQFARYYAGVTPRFDRQGRLLLSGWQDRPKLCLDQTIPVTRLVVRNKRYGVLSQILVRDSANLTTQTVVNQEFLDRGGCCTRVLTMPRNTGYQAMRYNGRFQLEQSAADLRRIEVTVPIPFLAWPGDLITFNRADWSSKESLRVLEAAVTMDQTGFSTCLLLGDPNAVL